MDNAGGYVAHPFVADFYDQVYAYRNRNDVPFFVELARESGGPVLEIGCGTGRVLIPTAEAGIEIIGMDLSSWMLAKCHEKISRQSEETQSRVELIEQDMRDFDLGRRFTLITTPFRPFQHLTTVEDQFSCLRAVRRHLDDSGRFVLDVFNPSIPALADETRKDEFGDEPEFELDDGRRVLMRARVLDRDFTNQVIDCEMIYYVTHPSGEKERLVHRFDMRYIFRYEAEHMLARCGFEVEALYGDYDKSAVGMTEYPGDLIFVARKM
jgi:SAM-dependent methyltransferase